MATGSESDAVPADLSAPIEFRRPKRGAFPTPEAEIEKATPFIPEIADNVVKPHASADVEGEGDG